MDELTYAAVCAVYGRLAGRLSDDAVHFAFGFYAAGEWDLGDATLLLNLAYEGVGITAEERSLIRSFLGDPDDPDLRAVPVVAAVPPVRHRFGPAGPAEAPDPARSDAVLSAEAPRHGGRRLHRAWREPPEGVPNGAGWVYVLEVVPGTDVLSAYSALAGRMWTALRDCAGFEVVDEGALPPPYQAAALAAAHEVRTA